MLVEGAQSMCSRVISASNFRRYVLYTQEAESKISGDLNPFAGLLFHGIKQTLYDSSLHTLPWQTAAHVRASTCLRIRNREALWAHSILVR